MTGLGRRSSYRYGSLVLLLLSLQGCASYSSRISQARLNYIQGNYQKALIAIDASDCESGKDQLIFLLERARIKQAGGDFKGSNEDFEKVYLLFRAQDDQAAIRIGDSLKEGGQLLTNETILTYHGYGYEKLLVCAYKAINYLMLGDPEGARVEIRRLDDRLKLEKKIHRKEIQAAEQAAQEKNLNRDQVSAAEGKLRRAFGPAMAKAAQIKDLYSSAFGSYLSALLYDLEGNFSEALIDDRRVEAIVPGFKYARNDAYLLSGEGAPPPSLPEDVDYSRRGDLLLFYQCGLAPEKEEVKIPIPTSHGFLATAFAVYRSIPTSLSSALVLIDGEVAGETEIPTDVEAQAIRTLVDSIPATIIRGALRMAAKAVFLDQAGKQGGGWGELIASIYNLASEQADLRSWVTLPRNIQALRIYPPDGKHRLQLALTGQGGAVVWKSEERDIELRNDQTILIDLIAIGYTPSLPEAVIVSEHSRTLHRVPLSYRPGSVATR